MISETHRQAINHALYSRRLRYPYHLRCLPLDKQDEWISLPPECRPEVQVCAQAAYAQRSVEMADYVTFYPKLVTAKFEHGIYKLHPQSPDTPPLLWLRFPCKTFKISILINMGTMEYLLSTGPKIVASDVELPPRGVTKKHPQAKNWLAWFATQRPDLHPQLTLCRE